MADQMQELLSEGVRETEAEILNEAFQDTPAQEPEVVEPEVEQPQEQARDETGKFTAKAEEKPAEVQPEKVEPEQADQGHVPSWRVREINEEKRAAQARAEAAERAQTELKSRLEMLERQIQQSQPKQEAKQEEIDPLIDPQGFKKSMQEQFNNQLRETRLNMNLELAHVKHGETFEKAFQSLLAQGQSGNRQLVNELTNQANPGEAIVKWYRDQETLREVGSDPAAYKQKLLDDALNDQAFLAKVVEKIKGGNGQQQRPNTITQLPPSLSRATGSNSSASIEDDTDGSDEAVFKYAMR